MRLLLASGNAGKLREFRALANEDAAGRSVTLDLLPDFSQLPLFDESAPTFSENAAGKALHYCRFTNLPVFADDSGLIVDALAARPACILPATPVQTHPIPTV
jgi:XTP/dITP diphosphohydrolase